MITADVPAILAEHQRAKIWAPSTAYSFGDVVQLPTRNGHRYVCITPGVSGAEAPTWSTRRNAGVFEGTAVWIAPEELEAFLELYGDIRGLMTMPPAVDDPEKSRPYFRRLRELAESHGLRELSMGTSQDYRVAADEGATFVRVGSILYGD